jgi:hypothetical protein
MHWDSSVSIGNVLTFIGMVCLGLAAFLAFMRKHDRAIQSIDNLSGITDGLQKTIAIQNGRLAKVETKVAIREEVERRMTLMEPPRELAVRAVREEVDKRLATLGYEPVARP